LPGGLAANRLDFPPYAAKHALNMAGVVLEQLHKTFRAPNGQQVCAVQNFSLTVADGELLTLVGPSGCGKTTLLRLIAGLETLEQGAVSIGGKAVNQTPAGERGVAMVFQNHALFPHLTVAENLGFHLLTRRAPKTEFNSTVSEVASLLELSGCLNRLPETLSGGERQRVALGRALAQKPDVLLLDEPLAHLDTPLRAQLRRELKRLHQRLKLTILCVTHDQAEATSLGQRVVVMRGGQLQQVAPPQELYERPASQFVAGFFGSPPMNFFTGVFVEVSGVLHFKEQVPAAQSKGFTLPIAPHSWSAQPNHHVVLGVRPEQLRLVRAEQVGSNVIPVRVELMEPLGADVLVHVRTIGHSAIVRVAASDASQTGEYVGLLLSVEKANFFSATGEVLSAPVS
jgi:multiple sugar transport system ATP-binding protein